jgi:23S rRNA (cytidine1920-2'-O)/16S rRNA (cytidine1409-2'-O)-methyltransferase
MATPVRSDAAAASPLTGVAAKRTRLDATMVARGLARSRNEAQALIADGNVTVAGAPATKPASLVANDQPVVVTAQRRWASRGGGKLEGALADFDVEVAGRHVLDAGASTGGFTDVLLSKGAQRVVAVDVGYGQLDWRLSSDDRVVVLDRTNVRHLRPSDVPPPPPSLVVADLSFISLTVVLPALVGAADPDAEYVLLVKPQFETAPDRIGKKGVVRDPAVWRQSLERVVAAAALLGLGLRDATVSPLRGPAGNVEFFVHLARTVENDPARLIDRIVSLASAR